MKEKVDSESIKHKKFLKDERKKDKLVKKNKEIKPKSRSGIIG
jgi:hypothetical protein